MKSAQLNNDIFIPAAFYRLLLQTLSLCGCISGVRLCSCSFFYIHMPLEITVFTKNGATKFQVAVSETHQQIICTEADHRLKVACQTGPQSPLKHVECIYAGTFMWSNAP